MEAKLVDRSAKSVLLCLRVGAKIPRGVGQVGNPDAADAEIADVDWIGQ